MQRFAASPQNGGGLELVGPLWYQRDGIAKMADIVNRPKPNRLVVFGAESAAINYKRLGKNLANEPRVDALTPHKLLDREIANATLLLRLGMRTEGNWAMYSLKSGRPDQARFDVRYAPDSGAKPDTVASPSRTMELNR